MTKFINKFSEEVFDTTYRYNNESIDEMHHRIASYLASIEKQSERNKYTKKFESILSNFKFVPGGRIMSNAGRSNGGTTMINCFVSGFEGNSRDSMEGILSELKRQALILKSEGGYGFCADTMRPRGSYINGIQNESPGSVKMLEMWDTQASVITEGSGKFSNKKDAKKKIRKGAQMVTESCFHPDIEEFISAKQTPGKLTKFNMSVLIYDEFIDAVKNKSKWDLIFPKLHSDELTDSELSFIKNKYGKNATIEELYDTKWDGNFKKWRYEYELPVEIYKTYSDANILWNIIMKSTYNRNEPGVLFIDTINKMNNMNYEEYISATNPCVTGDTLIYTADERGNIPISELANIGEDVSVFAINTDGEVVIRTMRRPRITGKNEKVFKLTLDNNSTIKATANHEFRLNDGSYKRLDELKIGDNLYVLSTCETIKKEKDNFITNTQIESDEKIDYNNTNVDSSLHKAKLKYLNQGYNCKIENNKIVFYNKCEVCGTEIKTFNREVTVCSKECKSIQRKKMNNTFDETKESLNSYKVVSVEYVGKETVYNGTVDEFHNFYVGGFEKINSDGNKEITYLNNMNCGEQVLPTNGSCLLGSTNLTQFVDIEKGDWKYDEIKETVTDAVRMLDNVNDLSYLPLESQRKEIQRKRRIGIGIMGYGSALYMLKIRYGSRKSIEITDKVMNVIINAIYSASALIAKEKGTFKAFDSEKFLKSNFIKILNSDTISLIKKYGLRNSHLSSIQPTGNSSILANTISGGLEPVFLPEYNRTSIVDNIPDDLLVPKNIDWSKLEQYDANDWFVIKEGDESILKKEWKGTVYKIDKARGLTKETLIEDYGVSVLKRKNEWDPNADWAVTTESLKAEDHLNVMKVFSKYIDSAVSKCVDPSTTMVIIDGKVKYIDELPHSVEEDSFHEFNGSINNHKNEMTNIKSVYNNGEADTLKIKFDDDSEIICTYNHKIYTDNGWKKAINLSIGDCAVIK